MSQVTELTSRRFRGYLPVVIDVETGGFHARTDALLELAAVIVQVDGAGRVGRGATHSWHVKPFEGSRLDPASLEVNGIDPWHPLRPASGPTSSSSWATTSACGTSVPTTVA